MLRASVFRIAEPAEAMVRAIEFVLLAEGNRLTRFDGHDVVLAQILLHEVHRLGR